MTIECIYGCVKIMHETHNGWLYSSSISYDRQGRVLSRTASKAIGRVKTR